MNVLELSLISSGFLCSLVCGFTLIFAVVVMPGISRLEDKEFLKAFQLLDGIIQNNQPIFLLIWLGSVVSILVTLFSSIKILGLKDSVMIISVCCIYLFGVQGITIRVHLPLNSRIKNLDIDNLDKENLNKERKNFENKWNYFNKIRAGIAFLVSLLLFVFISSL